MNVLVIVIEGARADHMSCCGYELQTTPFLDDLGRQGAYFSLAEPWRGNLIDTETARADALRRALFTWLSDTEQGMRRHGFDAMVDPAAARRAAVE